MLIFLFTKYLPQPFGTSPAFVLCKQCILELHFNFFLWMKIQFLMIHKNTMRFFFAFTWCSFGCFYEYHSVVTCFWIKIQCIQVSYRVSNKCVLVDGIVFYFYLRNERQSCCLPHWMELISFGIFFFHCFSHHHRTDFKPSISNFEKG